MTKTNLELARERLAAVKAAVQNPGAEVLAKRAEAVRAYKAALDAIKPGSRGAPALRAAAKDAYEAALDDVHPNYVELTAAQSDLDIEFAKFEGMRNRFKAMCTVLRTQDLSIGIGSPLVHVERTQSWNKYSKSWHCSYGPALESVTTIHIPETWLADVADRGLACPNDLVTLSAKPIELAANIGYEAFEAQWIVQGRGYNLSIESGVIVREGGREPQVAHIQRPRSDRTNEDLIEAGIKLLRRRAVTAHHQLAAKTADLTQHTDVLVRFNDARRAGLCDPGIRSWCARADINPEQGATIGRVLDALAKGAGQDTMAISACRQALSRSLVIDQRSAA